MAEKKSVSSDSKEDKAVSEESAEAAPAEDVVEETETVAVNEDENREPLPITGVSEDMYRPPYVAEEKSE